jgi:anti-sigma B factor antagonist
MTLSTTTLIKDVYRSPEGSIVVLSGEIDLRQSPNLHARLVEIVANRPRRMILDLAEVSHIDSSSVGVIVEIFRRVSAYRGKMVLFGLSPRVRSIFEITKLDKFFTIVDSRDQALAA